MSEKQRTNASSGSKLGSTPNSKLAPPEPDAPPTSPIASGGMPRSSDRIEEEMITSDNRCVPGGTDTRCLNDQAHQSTHPF